MAARKIRRSKPKAHFTFTEMTTQISDILRNRGDQRVYRGETTLVMCTSFFVRNFQATLFIISPNTKSVYG